MAQKFPQTRSRMIGLFAFYYGSLHFLTYLWLDRLFDFRDLAKDIAKRPYITVGSIAFFSMIPLAVTSTAGWIRRLGGRNWQLLHRLIYVTAIAGVTHYWWRVKADTLHPAIYAGIVAVLLGVRLRYAVKRARVARAPSPARA